MKNVRKLITAMGILALTLSTKASANEIDNQLNKTENDQNIESLEAIEKLVGFAPEKAIRTLEILAYSGASHFNSNGETQVKTTHLPLIIKSASLEKLETKISTSNKPGYVKIKMSDNGKYAANLGTAEQVRLKNIATHFQLKCHGGGVVP